MKQRTLIKFLGLLLPILCAAPQISAQPQTPDALLQPFYDFENDMAPWLALGEDAQLALAHGGENFKVGQGALRLNYGVQAGQINALILPTPLNGLGDTRSITFWVKADYDTTLAALFQERQGGRYAAMFHASANTWQRVELVFEDFLLLAGENDPQDPNGTLDIGKIEALMLADMSQIYAGAIDAKLVEMLGLKPGTHSLWLDDFALSRAALAPLAPAATTEKATVLEPLWHPQIAWIPIGGAQLSIETAAALPGRSLQIKSTQKRDSLNGLLKRLPLGVLRGAKQLRFEAVSSQGAILLVQFEEAGGGKYQATARLNGGDLLNKVSLEIVNFRASDDSKDQNGRLDLDQVTQIGLLDITGLLDATGADNTLLINNLRVIR